MNIVETILTQRVGAVVRLHVEEGLLGCAQVVLVAHLNGRLSFESLPK